MRLNEQGLKNKQEWLDKGYRFPEFDREKMIENTKKAPFWIHFGAGNIFRAFQANVVQDLLNQGVLNRGLTVCEGFDYEIIEKMYAPHDNIGILATFKADGSIEKTVVASIGEALTLNPQNKTEYDRLHEIFREDSLQMASFTITEKGYALKDAKGEILPFIQADFEAGPNACTGYMGKVVALLYERYLNGQKPIAFVSMDNCSHNGDKLYAAVNAFAKEWAERGLAEKGFVDYVNDDT